MRPIFIRKESDKLIRKVMVDMAYLVSHNQIRLPKMYYEEGLYLPVTKDNQIDRYSLTKDKIIKEDEFHYFFKFPFSAEQVENSAV